MRQEHLFPGAAPASQLLQVPTCGLKQLVPAAAQRLPLEAPHVQQEQLLRDIRQITRDKVLHVSPVAINASCVNHDIFPSSTHALPLGKQASIVLAATVQETTLLAQGAIELSYISDQTRLLSGGCVLVNAVHILGT